MDVFPLPTFVFQFARYLTQELHAGEYLTSDTSDEDDEDDDGGWLTQSRFDLGKPPPARRHNNGQSSSGFEVSAVNLVSFSKAERNDRRIRSILLPLVPSGKHSRTTRLALIVMMTLVSFT